MTARAQDAAPQPGGRIGHGSALEVLLVFLKLGSTSFGGPIAHRGYFRAVAVVAQAVWGMARSLCPDPQRAAIAIVATVLVLAMPGTTGQVGALPFWLMLGRVSPAIVVVLGAAGGWLTAGGLRS